MYPVNWSGLYGTTNGCPTVLPPAYLLPVIVILSDALRLSYYILCQIRSRMEYVEGYLFLLPNENEVHNYFHVPPSSIVARPILEPSRIVPFPLSFHFSISET